MLLLESGGKMVSDETGAAGDQNPHVSLLSHDVSDPFIPEIVTTQVDRIQGQNSE
jgi:hypothetical protein